MHAAARAISGVPTSITAFVGRARRGPTSRPALVRSVAEFEAIYGSPWSDAPLGSAVRLYFANGGHDALICRVRDATDAAISGPDLEGRRGGLWMLDYADLFNLLVIPPLRPDSDVGPETWDAAASYVSRRGAMLIVDPPAHWERAGDVTPSALTALISPGGNLANAALYFPRIQTGGATGAGGHVTLAPGGAIAGVYARTDAERGVFKAPAGLDARLAGTTGLRVALTDAESATLNRRGINAIRSFPSRGAVVWGARTMHGADSSGSEWKYVNVRRTALFIEHSIDRGTRWAVFEPNDEPLWAAIRLHVGAFLHDLFRRGAFPGRTPREAYFVKCDPTTMTQDDLDNGILVIEIGFAPLKPAEFVIIRIRHQTGQRAPARARPRHV